MIIDSKYHIYHIYNSYQLQNLDQIAGQILPKNSFLADFLQIKDEASEVEAFIT